MTKYLNIKYVCGVKIKIFFTVTIAIFMLSGIATAAEYLEQKQPSTVKPKFVDGEILVKFKSGVTAQAQQFTTLNLGGRSSALVGKKLRVVKIKLQEGSDVIATAEAYMANPNIEHAQPNYIYYISVIPNDASFNQLWGLKNTGQTISNPVYTTNNPGIAGYDIDAESAWNQITDCRSTIVAVIDTGINYTHQDLTGNMWDGSGSGFPNHGWDFVDGDNDPMPTRGNEDHGTHVAGTIGAYGNNSLGVTGVCWRANIMAVRVVGAIGATTANVISAIEFASDNGAEIINMSLGGEGAFDALFNNAITYARDRDVVVVVAAGNGGANVVGDDNDGLGDDGDINTIFYPCNFTQDNLICVAALDQSYTLASFSNYGATSVDVGAPGTNTFSNGVGQHITDIFTSGWSLSGGWASSICFSDYMLSNPANWCSFGTYGLNADDRAYKSFNLSGAIVAELNFKFVLDTELNVDSVFAGMKNTGGDPFAGGGTMLGGSGITGTTSGFWVPVSFDISSCNTSTCSLGFQLISDSSIVDRGVAIKDFAINTVQTNSTSYHLSSGTSMASPHVAGIATMVRAFNPNYSYTQTVEAIKNGGEIIAALSGITTTGQAANAMGALAYITQPSGVVAIVQ